MRYRIIFLLCIALLALNACNLSGDLPTPEPIGETPDPSTGLPQITILSVRPSQTISVNTEVTITASVSDPVGVTRVQLTANGRVVTTYSSASSQGDRNATIDLEYTPTSIGAVTLQVVASRLDGTSSEPAAVELTVNAVPTVTRIASTTGSTTGGGEPAPNPCLGISVTQCSACVNNAAGANLRPSPTTAIDRIGFIEFGTVVPIIGRTTDSTWWQVRVNNSVSAWVSNTVVNVLGVCSSIPAVAQPGAPTATSVIIPTNTAVVPTNTSIPQQPTATTAPPDLVIPTLSGEGTLSLATSNSATYTVVITNTGGSTTGTFSNTLTVQPGNRVIDLAVVSSLLPGQSITLPIQVSFSAAGSYTLTARADSGSNVTESFEGNNTNSLVVTVNP